MYANNNFPLHFSFDIRIFVFMCKITVVKKRMCRICAANFAPVIFAPSILRLQFCACNICVDIFAPEILLSSKDVHYFRSKYLRRKSFKRKNCQRKIVGANMGGAKLLAQKCRSNYCRRKNVGANIAGAKLKAQILQAQNWRRKCGTSKLIFFKVCFG